MVSTTCLQIVLQMKATKMKKTMMKVRSSRNQNSQLKRKMKDNWTTERLVEAAETPALLMATPATGSSGGGGERELTYRCRHRTWSG